MVVAGSGEGVRVRLQRAAMELYGERGYSHTTVAAVAARAGVTERTFFRHFADKREVLFADGETLLEVLVHAVRTAPPTRPAWPVALGAVRALAAELGPHRAELRVRAAVLTSDPDLSERDNTKQTHLTRELQRALQERGAAPDEAALAALAARAVFAVAYRAWLEEPGRRSLRARVDAAAQRLEATVSVS